MTAPQPGWYSDPNGGSGLRWWDGAGWTPSTQEAPPAQPVAAGYGQAPDGQTPYGQTPYGTSNGQAPNTSNGQNFYGQQASGPGMPSGAYPAPVPPAVPASALSRSKMALGTVAVCVVYCAIAHYLHYVFLGIVPVLLTVQSFKAKEPLAVLALVASALTLCYTIYLYAN